MSEASDADLSGSRSEGDRGQSRDTWSSADGETELIAERPNDISWSNQAARAVEDVAVAAFTGTGATDAEEVQRASTNVERPVREARTKRRHRAVEVAPVLTLPRVKGPEAIALFVHGGEVTGNVPVVRADPAYLRMLPFARDLERRTHGRVGAAVIRLAIRGWNHPELPAMEDTSWAIERLKRRYPDLPLGIAGHSMGGRVVLGLFDRPDVDAGLALAPWAAEEYAAEPFVGKPLLVIHGRRDLVTSPTESADFVARVRRIGGDARFLSMAGGHSMVRGARQWQRHASEFLEKALLH